MGRVKKKIKNDGSFKTTGEKAGVVIDEMAKEFADFSFDPHEITEKVLKFGKILTGIPLYRYQEKMAYRIIYSILTLEGATISMILARQSGKSETLAFVVNTLSVLLPAIAPMFPELEQFSEGIKIGLFAPQSDQVYTTYNRALLRLTSENAEEVMGDPDLQVYLDKPTRYELSNGSFMMGQVASKQSKIESKTYDLVLIEEAQDMDDRLVQKSIEPMVSATGGTIVKCGTTGLNKSDFWYEIQYNRKQSRLVKDPRLHHHFEFNYKKIFADKRFQYEKDSKLFHLLYEKDVTKKLKKWGRDSQAFKLSYALEWELESGMMFTDKEFNSMLNRRKGLFNFTEKDIIIAGIDLGQTASTVVTLGKLVWDPDDEEGDVKKEVIGWIEIKKIDYEMQHRMLVDIFQEYMVQSVAIDYTGVGKPIVERLEYAVGDWVHIIPYTFSKQSKSDMWYNLIEHRQAGRLIVPANKQAQGTEEWQNFQEQLLNCQKWYDGAYICAEKSEGYKDDYVDSLGLMCLADVMEEVEEFEIVDDNPFVSQAINNRKLRNINSY